MKFRRDEMTRHIHQAGVLDAGESAFFARQLEHIRPESYDVEVLDLLARTYIPVDNSVPPGADSVTYRQYTGSGFAKVLAAYSDDLPRSDLFGKEFSVKFKPLGTSYGYNFQEIRSAQMTGMPLEQRRGQQARRAMEELIDAIATSGDSATGLLGLLNQTSATVYSIPNGAAGTQAWSTKTPSEVLADMNGIVTNAINLTHGKEKPNTMLLPISQYTDVSTRVFSAQNSSNVTILQMFLKNSPSVTDVQSWYALSGAGAAGADRAVAYERNPRKLMLVISQEFEQFPPQPKNFEFVIPCHARIAGVQAPYPLSINYMDNI